MTTMRTALFAALALFAGTPAFAADFYGGASVGQDLDRRFGNLPGEVHADSSLDAWLGWNFSEPFAAELSYHDFGDAKCCSAAADFGFKASSDGWSLGAVYAPRFGAFAPLAKLGWFHASIDEDTVSIAGPRHRSDTDSGLMAELGGRWFINDTFVLRVGYEWFDFDARSDGALRIGGEVHF